MRRRTAGCASNRCRKRLIDHLVHPSLLLRTPARGKPAVRSRQRNILQHALPQLADARSRLRRAGDCARRPSRLRCREKVQRVLRLGARTFRGSHVCAIGLVYRHQVGQFHHAALDALQLIARAGQRDQQKEVHHLVHRGLRLAHADRLHQDVPVSRSLAQQHRLARPLRHAAGNSARGRRPDKRHLARRERRHARLVAQNAAAGDLAAGVDRQHRDLLASAPRSDTRPAPQSECFCPRRARP